MMKERMGLIVMDHRIPDGEAFIRQMKEDPATGAVRMIVLNDKWQRSRKSLKALKNEMGLAAHSDRHISHSDMKIMRYMLAGIAVLLLLAWIWSTWVYR